MEKSCAFLLPQSERRFPLTELMTNTLKKKSPQTANDIEMTLTVSKERCIFAAKSSDLRGLNEQG